MNDKNLHINNLEEKSKELFSNGKINWEKPEADVWTELSQKIDNVPAGRKISMISLVAKYAAVAVFFILLGLGALTFLFTKTLTSLPGEHIVAELPDGSSVELNAGSTLKYYPLKWQFERKLHFEGEGFFNVQKGKNFEVVSKNGITQVIGTSFNIYARESNYRVTCLTGLVKVISKSEESVLLEPNSHAEIDKGEFVVKKNYKTEKVVGWKKNLFYFSGTPLKEVIDEIERQYGVAIQLQPELDNRNFVGNFPKEYNVEEVLNFVCKTMAVKFVKQSENVYLIVEKS
jgi:transmembrane sensor